jgi:hypothetical protein
MARKSLRSQLYRAARDLGNVEAAEKGPPATAAGWCAARRTGRPTGPSAICSGGSFGLGRIEGLVPARA